MSAKSILLAIVGAVVALFYGLESFLFFQANGFAAPLLVKLAICGAGVYLFWRNVRPAPASTPSSTPGNEA